jgi:hypothetical protein
LVRIIPQVVFPHLAKLRCMASGSLDTKNLSRVCEMATSALIGKCLYPVRGATLFIPSPAVRVTLSLRERDAQNPCDTFRKSRFILRLPSSGDIPWRNGSRLPVISHGHVNGSAFRQHMPVCSFEIM